MQGADVGKGRVWEARSAEVFEAGQNSVLRKPQAAVCRFRHASAGNGRIAEETAVLKAKLVDPNSFLLVGENEAWGFDWAAFHAGVASKRAVFEPAKPAAQRAKP